MLSYHFFDIVVFHILLLLLELNDLRVLLGLLFELMGFLHMLVLLLLVLLQYGLSGGLLLSKVRLQPRFLFGLSNSPELFLSPPVLFISLPDLHGLLSPTLGLLDLLPRFLLLKLQ